MKSVNSKRGMKLAHIIRIATVPPVMAAVLILAMWRGAEGVVLNGREAFFCLLFISVVPALAYPVSVMIPSARKKGREAQRNIAFFTSLGGYTAAWLWSTAAESSNELMFMCATYFFSVLILLVFNKLLGLRASGHACSVTGPVVLIISFIGGCLIPVCIAAYALSFWASVKSGRHTCGEYLLGTLSCIFACIVSLIIYIM